MLPFSSGSEAEVIVSNPMPYPVEIYSLTFDQQYIDEEEVCVCASGVFLYTVYCMCSIGSTSPLYLHARDLFAMLGCDCKSVCSGVALVERV